jgi:integrase
VAGDTTIAGFADRWLAEYVRPKLKPRTVADYERLLEQRIKPVLGHLTVARIAKEDVLRWHASMKDIPRRANYAVATLRSMLTYAEDVSLRPPMSNPCRRIKLYRERQRERFLSEEELGRAAEGIAAAERAGKIGPHAAAGLRLALFTGARSGEIRATEWKHVDWQRRIIRLPDSKTNEPRTIHLSEAALEVLRTVPRVGTYIIAGALPDESFRNLTRAWDVARRFAGLQDVRLHDLRHSFASLAAARGVSLQMIGKLLGHKVAATTQRYAHLARNAAAAVNDELGEAMVAAINRKTAPGTTVVRLPRRQRKGATANG